MVMNILADLKSTGAINDDVLTKSLLDSGDLKIVWNGFVPSVVGEPTADRVLIALHKGGMINAVKLIGETITNLKASIDSDMTNAQKVAKIDEAIEYLKVVRNLIADGEETATFPEENISLDEAYNEPPVSHSIMVL